MKERAVDTRDSDSAQRWRRVAQKAKKREVTAEEESREGGGGSGGCEAAVKRGRVRESRGAKPELAGRVDTDREESRGGGRTEESEERTRRTEDGG